MNPFTIYNVAEDLSPVRRITTVEGPRGADATRSMKKTFPRLMTMINY